MGKVGGRNYLAGEGGQQLVKEEREGKVADGGVESKRGQYKYRSEMVDNTGRPYG